VSIVSTFEVATKLLRCSLSRHNLYVKEILLHILGELHVALMRLVC